NTRKIEHFLCLKKIFLALLFIVTSCAAIDRYEYAIDKVNRLMYIFDFNDQLDYQIILNDLSQYRNEIVAFHNAKDQAQELAVHQAMFDKIFKGATMIITVVKDRGVIVRPRDRHHALGYYYLWYANINTDEVKKWLNSRSKKKSGNPMIQVLKEADKLKPIIEKQFAENQAQFEKNNAEIMRQQKEREAVARKKQLENERILLNSYKKTNKEYFKTVYGEKIKKDYPELIKEYEAALKEVNSWW
ncbi:hypothetical protein NO1_1373, partial [Candidatus Termititenax aidoneus]